MVPRGGGGRVRRGPHDHLEAIIYMSRATPRKTKGTADWLGPGRAGSRQAAPLAHRDHGPDGPDGPEGVDEPRRRPPAPSRVSGGGPSLVTPGTRLAGGTMWASGPGEATTRARGRSPSVGGGATVRTWFGARPQARSALVRSRLRLNRLWSSPRANPAHGVSRPSPGRAPRRGYSRGFTDGPRAAFRTPFKPGAERPARAAVTGIIVGVVPVCFSFAF